MFEATTGVAASLRNSADMVGQQLPCALSGMAVPLKAHDHILRACPFMPPGQRLYLVGFLAFRRVPSRSFW